MVRGALTGAWSLVSGFPGGRRSVGGGRPAEMVRLRARVRELERQVAALRAAADALGRPGGTTS